MAKAMGEPIKIVATVRPIAECIASFYLIDKSDLPIEQWIKQSELMVHLWKSYESLKDGYEKYPDQFCIVEYDDLINHTQRELDRVADFIGWPKWKFNSKIEQVDENDNAWGIKDLHKLSEKIEPNNIDAEGILGKRLFKHYQGGEFWNDKPEPVKNAKNEPLNLALEAGLHGNFDKAYEILKEIERTDPNDRSKFNLGWYEMMRGNLLKGHILLTHGRNEGVFGNNPSQSGQPFWNGERDCIVLMEMEGGSGDQIHGIRFAKNIANDYNCRVIISGCQRLVDICKDVEGVSAFCQHEVAEGIYHDYQTPNMSIGVPLRLEYSDLCGKPYLPKVGKSEGKVGIKWFGNPKFEHQQHRLFPKELLFDAVEGEDLLCLQKEGEKPEYLYQPSLEEWGDTVKAISKCDLVISSCSSVAHLAGAMGVETWIVVPILPYYMWAYPGDKTPYYDSVTLFRQEKYGCWKAPFKKIKQALIQRRVALWSKATYNEYGDTTRAFIEA